MQPCRSNRCENPFSIIPGAVAPYRRKHIALPLMAQLYMAIFFIIVSGLTLSTWLGCLVPCSVTWCLEVRDGAPRREDCPPKAPDDRRLKKSELRNVMISHPRLARDRAPSALRHDERPLRSKTAFAESPDTASVEEPAFPEAKIVEVGIRSASLCRDRAFAHALCLDVPNLAVRPRGGR